MNIQQKNKNLKAKIAKIEAKRSALYLENSRFEKENFQEIYVGKFWKKNEFDSIRYSYCKNFVQTNFGINGIFDTFKIANDGTLRTYTSCKKDHEESSLFLFCEIEITSQEFDEALENFKNTFFDFIRIKREILIEKI